MVQFGNISTAILQVGIGKFTTDVTVLLACLFVIFLCSLLDITIKRRQQFANFNSFNIQTYYFFVDYLNNYVKKKKKRWIIVATPLGQGKES